MKYTKDNIQELLDEIKRNNAAYRKGEPVITNAEYDCLVDTLRRIDPDNEWFLHPEPSAVSFSRKVQLPIPMKSLDKVKTLAALKRWCKSLGLTSASKLVCMPKFDGISLLHNELTGMTYSRGGADNEGQDCSAHYQKLGLESPEPCDSSFQYTFGELLFSRHKWRQFKEELPEEEKGNFKSPRNTTAGLINRDVASDLLKYLTFFRYGVDSASRKDYSSFMGVIADICLIYGQMPLYEPFTVGDLTDEALIDLFKQWNALYPIDGIVVYVNDLRVWEAAGRHQTSGNPLYAVAYKHPDFTDNYETEVKDITWNISKSGAFKPIVNIEPVDTGDCNMENPTGYNAEWVLSRRIGKGAKVIVTRSGGVIPKILDVTVPATDEEMDNIRGEMSVCPYCGSATEWNESKIELCCPNAGCPGRTLSEIVFFYNICRAEDMGEEIIRKIFEAGHTSLKSILHITYKDLVKIPGIGDDTAGTVIANNKKIMKGLDLTAAMHASNCFQSIGQVKAKAIIEGMNDDEVARLVGHTLQAPDNIVGKTMAYFYQGLPKFYQFLDDTGIPVFVPKKQVPGEGEMDGVNVCMSGFRDKLLEDLITDNGGKVVGGISKNTSVLVVKDLDSGSSKITKANAINIPVMTIEEFLKKYSCLSMS